MKKIFTLIFSVGMFAMAQAQPGTRDNRQTDQPKDQRDFNMGYDNGRDVVVNNNSWGRDDRYDKDISFSEREKDMQIARINREYSYRIQKVQRSYYMNWFEKQRKIRFLQAQRQQEISKVLYQFKNRRGYQDDCDNHYNDHDNHSNDRDNDSNRNW